MRSISLKDLIYRSYLSSSLIPIFVIEFVLIILYFGASYFITHQSQKTLYLSASQSLHEITTREAQKISHQFQDVSRIAIVMQTNHEDFFRTPQSCFVPNTPPEFAVHENGVYYKINDNGGSSTYYSSTTSMTEETKRKASCSESMDPLMKSIVQTNPIITQAYFNSWDNFNRLYPFMVDAPAQYGMNLKMEDYNFYYLADATHNLQRKPVWTTAYLDPAGQGWMISNIVPIYNKDFLEGVSGLDVTIDSLLKNILSLSIPWNGSAFLVDADGMILAMPERVEAILGLKELKEHLYKSSINQTIQKPEEYNIFKIKNEQLREKIGDFFKNFNQFGTIKYENSSYLVSQESIPETGWRLIVLVDEALVYKPIHNLKQKIDWIGYAAIILMVLFYLLFFSYLLRKSSKLARKIAVPIEELSFFTSNLGNKADNQIYKRVGITEVDILTQNFNKVSLELDARTKEYVESQLREKMQEKDAEIAYKAGLFESASSYLHNIGNTLTMLDSKILLLRQIEDALGKSGIGIGRVIGMISKSSATLEQKEEVNRFLQRFEKALTQDVTQEIEDVVNSIESINKQAALSIHHQQDLFNANVENQETYTQLFDVKTMLEELVEDYRVSFNKHGVMISLECDDSLMLKSIKFQFHNGLSNVLKNALESIEMYPEMLKGTVVIRAFRENNKIVIDIEDNGVGVKSIDMDKIFKSGFTTKKHGHGLGLHSFNNFLNSHNGRLAMSSDGYLKGATLHIEIGDDNV